MSETDISRQPALPPETFATVPTGSILGINYSGHHDSAIAIVAPDGRPVFACALERLTRVKQDGRPPVPLLRNLPWERIAAIAVSTDEYPSVPEDARSRFHPAPLYDLRATCVPHQSPFYAFFDSLPVEKHFFCHQMSHAASAYVLSGFEEAICLTYDGGMLNSPWFGGLFRGANGRDLEPIERFANSHYAKVSSLYLVMTALLGFTPLRHEGKITGLAAYGTQRPEIRMQLERLFTSDYGQMESLVEWRSVYSTDVPPYLLVKQAAFERLAARFAAFSREDIAATLQGFTEEHILAILRSAREAGITAKSICLAGGLFANVKLNQRVWELGFEQVFVAPPMTDDGTALGAAFLLGTKLGRAGSPSAGSPRASMYLGPSYTPEPIREALAKHGVVAEEVTDFAGDVADDLAAGRVVALFSGAMEYGPRALGHRSILASAQDPAINVELNARLRRTEFMPFAPIVRHEDAASLFGDITPVDGCTRFMTVTCDCTDRARSEAPAVIHVDGTARPQIVFRDEQPLLHGILGAYHARTQRSALINTSFNVHEEPIVCSPEDALAGFFDSGLDRLYFDCGLRVRLEANAMAAYRSLRSRLGAKSQRERQLVTEARIRDSAAVEDTLFALMLQWTRSENELEATKALLRREQHAPRTANSAPPAIERLQHERDAARTLAQAALADLEMLRGLVEYESSRAEQIRQTFIDSRARPIGSS